MKDVRIRPIEARDDQRVASIIRQVLTEFGLNREGFAFVDSELDQLSAHYIPPRAAYFVAEEDGRILGGAGFAPLLGGGTDTAELKKMYLLPEGRGFGFGERLMQALIPLAEAAGYRKLYLETVAGMTGAIRLYKKHGFVALKNPMGSTGHFGCESYFCRDLQA